jgi:transcriptional regulator with XRE-family HTH domain
MQQFAAAEIGARIAQARREAGGVTQEQLAELLNVSTRSIQDYEAGTTIPWRHFQQLSAVFNRKVEWFLRGDEQEPEVRESATPDLERRLEEVAALVGEGLARLEAGIADVARRLPDEDNPAQGNAR